MTKPLSPSEVEQKKLPSFVIEAVNSLLMKKTHFTQGELVQAIFDYAPKRITSSDIYDNNWLDIEYTYEQAGWNIRYDRPGYNETYEANFTFTPKTTALTKQYKKNNE